MEDNKVIEIYDRMCKYLNSLSLKEKQVSLEGLMDIKYVGFQKKFLENIKLLCDKDMEFLINEGYLKYGFYEGSFFSFKWGIINTINDLQEFIKSSNPLRICQKFDKYITYIQFQKKSLEDYEKGLMVINEEKKKEIEYFLNHQVDANFMKNYDIYMEIVTNLSLILAGNIDKFLAEIPILVFSYIYINKLDIDFMELYQKIDIYEIIEYLLLNGLMYKIDSLEYYHISEEYKEDDVLNIMYQYIIDNVFKEVVDTKKIIKKGG